MRWADDHPFRLGDYAQREDSPAYVERLEEALRECVRLSGADLSDGFPSWPQLPEFAVQEVGRLRADYDEEL